jgi:hypothetical protein
VTITNFGIGSQLLVYGQQQSYSTTLSVASGSALPTGSVNFLNESSVLSSFALAQGTDSGSTVVSTCPSAAGDAAAAAARTCQAQA